MKIWDADPLNNRLGSLSYNRHYDVLGKSIGHFQNLKIKFKKIFSGTTIAKGSIVIPDILKITGIFWILRRIYKQIKMWQNELMCIITRNYRFGFPIRKLALFY